MKKDFDKDLIIDLIEIERKKNQIKETLEYTQTAYRGYLVKERKRKARLWVLASASAAAIFIFGLTIFPSFLALNGPDQYTQYYKLFNGSVATRATDKGDPLVTLYNLYNAKELVRAQHFRDSILGAQPDNQRLVFISALIDTELGQWDKAMKEFNITSQLGGSYELYSRWYLALIHLRNNDYDQCKEQLLQLKKMKDNPFQKEIKKIYRKIRFRNTK
jgi:hypothetical protein